MLSELTAEGQIHLSIVNPLKSRRRVERIVKPLEQVAIDKQLLP